MRKQTNNLDKYWALERLKALYYELSSPVRNYFKSFIKIELKNGGHYYESVIHDQPDHIKLDKRGHRSAKRVTPVGNTIKEFTSGLLYAPQASNQYRSMDYETALCFVCDVDLARRKSGKMEDGILPYIEGINLGSTKVYITTLYNELREWLDSSDRGEVSRNHPRINELRKLIEKSTGEPPFVIRNEDFGQKESSKKFSDELMDKFGDNCELKEWILSNAETLDTETHEDVFDTYKERQKTSEYVEYDYFKKNRGKNINNAV